MRVGAWVAVASLLCGACKNRETAGKNRRCEEAVKDGRVDEARSWLAPSQSHHVGFKVGADVMRELTESFYQAGAVQVRAAYSEVGDVQLSALLIIDLPDDKAARGALFARFEEVRADYELDAEKDVGQSCLLLGLD